MSPTDKQLRSFQGHLLEAIRSGAFEASLEPRDILHQLLSLAVIWAYSIEASPSADSLHEALDQVFAHYRAQMPSSERLQ